MRNACDIAITWAARVVSLVAQRRPIEGHPGRHTSVMLTSEHLQAKTGRTLRRGVAGFLPLLVFSLLAATSLPAESRVTSPAASYDENPLAEAAREAGLKF